MIIRILLAASFGIPLACFGILRRRNVNLALWTSGLFGVVTILSALVARFWQTHNPIGAGMVESLGLFVFFLYAVVFLVRRVTYPRVLVMFLAAIVSLLLAFLPSNVFMPKNFAPILNSLWFYVHLPLFFAGYAALSLDFACVVLGERPILTWSFLLLCAGLISGGYWAFFAWGLPWSWDAKECWALGTLFFVAAAKRAHDDKLRNTFTVIAFCAMVFTFVGVAFLFASRHAYQ